MGFALDIHEINRQCGVINIRGRFLNRAISRMQYSEEDRAYRAAHMYTKRPSSIAAILQKCGFLRFVRVLVHHIPQIVLDEIFDYTVSGCIADIAHARSCERYVHNVSKGRALFHPHADLRINLAV